MKFYLFFLFICFFGNVVQAQQNHFVYVQTDNKQPFYIQVNEKVFSSSATGYVVIPKLQNGTYTFQIGFPKNEWPQQSIPVTINNKDAGFLLKNFNSKGWGLFDMQTLNVIMPATSTAKVEATENKNDAFSNVLADVVNTPSLKEKPKEELPVKKEEVPVKKEEVPVKIEEPVIVKTAEPIVESVVQAKNVQADTIKKVSSVIDNEGRAMVYIDHSGDYIDTVQIFIPYETVAVAEVKIVNEKPTVTVPDTIQQVSTIPNPEKTDAKFINIELPNPNTPTDTITISQPVKPVEEPVKSEAVKIEPVVQPPVSGVQMINSDCKNFATEEDFLKARKKMVGESNDEEMISAARKIFRNRCFSTEQVKNLSVLFLKDEGKYKFFDTAYPFVHDSRNFNTLEMQLTDEYYKTRFRAMIRK